MAVPTLAVAIPAAVMPETEVPTAVLARIVAEILEAVPKLAVAKPEAAIPPSAVPTAVRARTVAEILNRYRYWK